MQAVILAAGKGSRFKQATKNIPKCMLQFNGETLISRLLRQLNQLDLQQIVIVAGYKADVLKTYLSTLSSQAPITVITNSAFATSNNILSVAKAAAVMADDETLLFESDVILRDDVVKTLAESPTDAAVVSPFRDWMEGTAVELDADQRITAFVPREIQNPTLSIKYYKTVNVYKLSRDFNTRYFLPYLQQQIHSFGANAYYETVFGTLTALKEGLMKATVIAPEDWDEVDTSQELHLAEIRMGTDPFVKMKQLSLRYGGYWRFPELHDYAYLVNPFFPPDKLVNQYQRQLKRLLIDYPSGLAVNSEHAADAFNLPVSKIVVGNGAAELIQAVSTMLTGRVGVIRPTFEEYPNRLPMAQVAIMPTEQHDFHYSAADIKAHFANDPVKTLIVINPDNPSGNYLPKAEVLDLCQWTADHHIRLIVDESFIDFSNLEPQPSLLDDQLLAKYPNLVVIKSISKSYGVPGVRLGILASGDESLIAKIKQAVPIWNINAFGEFFLQRIGQFTQAYRDGMQVFYDVRAHFLAELHTIPFMEVLPSQANFFMVRLIGVTSQALCAYLLQTANILIKDLTTKQGINGEYVRLAIKTRPENQALIQALREYQP